MKLRENTFDVQNIHTLAEKQPHDNWSDLEACRLVKELVGSVVDIFVSNFEENVRSGFIGIDAGKHKYFPAVGGPAAFLIA